MSEMVFPKFYEGQELPKGYYDTPNPFECSKTCINILELSRYAQQSGKSPISMTNEELAQFLVCTTH